MDTYILQNERTNKCRSYFERVLLGQLVNYNCWVAGGAIRTWYANERMTDIDLFAPNEKELEKCLNHIKGLGGEVTFENENVTKVLYDGRTIDFCRKYYPSPEATIRQFDFTVTMAAVDHKHSYFGEAFFMDLASKRLAINALPYPASSIQRMQKYVRRGYFMCKEELVKLIAGLHEIDMEEFIIRKTEETEAPPSDSERFPGID